MPGKKRPYDSDKKEISPDYGRYKEPQTKPVTVRMDEGDIAKIERYAEERGLKKAQVIRAWILERMRSERLR